MVSEKSRITGVKTVVITDFDNTLYDWFNVWHESFSALVNSVVEISGVNKDQLLSEIKSIHEKHKTTEYSWLLEELPVLKAMYSAEEIKSIFDPSIHAFRSARKRCLKLYDGVFDTLVALRERGVLVVSYTESLSYPTVHRVKKLDLDGLIKYLYSSPDHDAPQNISVSDERMYSDQYYELESTVHRHTARGAKKPNTQILLGIIADIGARPDECIYIGDSLSRDMAMAIDADVASVFAQYGVAHNDGRYKLLEAVTYWTETEVKQLQKSVNDIKPDIVLEKSFNEILKHFEFGEFRGVPL